MDDRNVLISEYRSLRSEIMKRQDARLLLVGFSVTGIAALSGLVLKDNSLINNLNNQLLLFISILLITIIALLLTYQQTQQIDILFKNLKTSELLALYLGRFTNDLSKKEVEARKYLSFYYFMIIIGIIFISSKPLLSPYFKFIPSYISGNILYIVLAVFIVLSLILIRLLSKKGMHGEEYFIEYIVDSLLTDENPKIRIRAAKALANVEAQEKVIEPLISSLHDEEKIINTYTDHNGEKKYEEVPVYKTSQNSLKNIGKPAVIPLINSLNHENNIIKRRIGKILGYIGDKRAVDPLLNLLVDEDRNLRAMAADSLGDIGDRRAVKPLIGALQDEELCVLESVIGSLGKIKDKEAIEPISKFILSKHNFIRKSSFRALSMMDDDKATQYIIDGLRREEDNNTQNVALNALCKIGSKKAVEALKEFSSKNVNSVDYIEKLLKKIERRKTLKK